MLLFDMTVNWFPEIEHTCRCETTIRNGCDGCAGYWFKTGLSGMFINCCITPLRDAVHRGLQPPDDGPRPTSRRTNICGCKKLLLDGSMSQSVVLNQKNQIRERAIDLDFLQQISVRRRLRDSFIQKLKTELYGIFTPVHFADRHQVGWKPKPDLGTVDQTCFASTRQYHRAQAEIIQRPNNRSYGKPVWQRGGASVRV